MIKYKLACDDCEITFDSWFATSKEFERLKRKKLLICYNCNSLKVDKTIMAPTLINNKKNLNKSFELDKYENIKKTINRVKYWYNDKLYKYITYDTKLTWPPKETSGMTFNMPLTSAHLIDPDDKPMKDVLNKIKRYAGPRGNFHGQEVKISDMLYYDIETLKEFYPKIKLKNVLGLTKIVSTTEDCITDLRIP